MIDPSRFPYAHTPNTRSFIDFRKPQNGAIKLLTLICLLALGATVYLNWSYLEDAAEVINSSPMGYAMLICGQVFMVVTLSAFVWQLILMLRYRPSPTLGDAELPKISVVVPAYNEGKGVMDTIESLLASDYPADKLQILAVDDGSKDDTWSWMEKAAAASNGRVQAMKMAVNSGKRHALYEGFLRSTGEVYVTVDSDSIVDPMALRNLVSPFSNSRVGAVAGNVRVKNLHDGAIPRMLDVSFLFSFDFQRSSQSQVNTVMCTPGALSAYRCDAVANVLEAWRDQTFRGLPANHGEDRHLTNLILRNGYHVLFQQNALVYTDVPTGYRGLCRMFLRWARSNVRETLVMSTFLFGKFREGSAWGARINLLLAWMSLTVSQLMLLVTLTWLAMLPHVFFVQIMLGIVIGSTAPALLYALRTRSDNAIYAYVYGIFWFLLLSWITPYAVFTSHHNGWLTREPKPTDPAAKAQQSTPAA